MKNFMIGQFGYFDFEKLKRDFREGFYGIEACMLNSQADVLALHDEARKRNFDIGIHFPLRAGVFASRDPLFMDLDTAVRKQAFKNIEEELRYISDMGIKPSYILFHYPKPVILSENFDLSRWRFSHRSEFVYETEYPFDKLSENSEILFRWLSEKSSQYNFIPVLELDAINRYISNSTFLEELLDKYNVIKLCIDLGRLHVQDRIDPQFSAMDILERFAKYAEVIHLWNAKVGDNVLHNHFPLLPGLYPKEGWADVEAYFQIIRSENKNAKLLFEHRSDLITDEELDSCYKWIGSLFYP